MFIVKKVQQCLGHTDSINSVSWSHDSAHLATASDDKTVRIWDAKTGKEVQQCLGHTSRVCSVSWAHDSAHLATASEDKTVRIWGAKRGK